MGKQKRRPYNDAIIRKKLRAYATDKTYFRLWKAMYDIGYYRKQIIRRKSLIQEIL